MKIQNSRFIIITLLANITHKIIKLLLLISIYLFNIH